MLEISHVINTLHLVGTLGADQMHVRLVLPKPVPEAAQVSIDRISVFRQST